jgi:RNA polymerase sigma-70 factor (ECF subfamily)
MLTTAHIAPGTSGGHCVVLNLARRPNRDTEARFRAHYDAHHGALHRYVCRLSGDYAAAEDVMQEIFVQLWKEMTTAGEPRAPRAWLYRVATNLVIDRGRTLRRTLAFILPSSAATAEPPAPSTDTEENTARRQLVQRALRRIPEPMRQCLLLHHEGLSGKEIAEVLGVKPSYVGTLVLRAHDRFRREWEVLGGRDGLS